MSAKQVRAEVQSLRRAADKVMTSKASAEKFLAAIRVDETRGHAGKVKTR